MKIVIVDDQESIRKLLRALCESEGHEVVAEFDDGVGLLDYVMTYHPDVVCLDFNLPGEDGIKLLAQMDANANHVDVVMITGSDDPELKGHAADLGATGFIHKPFEQSQVITELKEIQQTRSIAARVAAASDVPELSLPDVPTPDKDIGVVLRSAVIVDDSGSMRLLLKGILEEIGIKVVGLAASGSMGVEVVKQTHPALVCLDVDMPVMTGIEALPQVRAASPKTKIVMVTGNASRSIVQAAITGGAIGYFLKPIRPGKVEEFMRKLF
jgi:DNA-binding NarL/FixJ family response regulator